MFLVIPQIQHCVESRRFVRLRPSGEVCPDAPCPGRSPTDRAGEVIYSQPSSLSERCNCNLEIRYER